MSLDKSDFKGQRSGEKVYTLCKAYQGYRPRCENVALAVALTRTITAKHAIHGAVSRLLLYCA